MKNLSVKQAKQAEVGQNQQIHSNTMIADSVREIQIQHKYQQKQIKKQESKNKQTSKPKKKKINHQKITKIFKFFILSILSILIILLLWMLLSKNRHEASGTKKQQIDYYNSNQHQNYQQQQKQQKEQQQEREQQEDQEEQEEEQTEGEVEQSSILNYMQTRIMEIITKSTKPQKYQNIGNIIEVKQLPFCIIIHKKSKKRIKQIQQSIKKQNYTNYITIVLEKNKNQSYFNFKQQIGKKCQKHALIMIVKNNLKQSLLKQLNNLHQTQNIWATYSRSKNYLQIFSFYSRIFQLLEINDFNSTNMQYLNNGTPQIFALSILQLCQLHLREFNQSQVNRQTSFLSIRKRNSQIYQRQAYTKLFKLSQDYYVNQNVEQQNYDKIKNLKRQPYNIMSPEKMLNAIHRLQLAYLPQNHTLNQLQFQQYKEKYGIQKFSQRKDQISFCLTILNHNNIQNLRYKKLFLSIIQQKYQNYHIVFIDDFSTDNSLQSVKQLVEKTKFPKDRIKFVKNINRMYATYNIINAAFNSCKQDDVQLLLDGDDEIIGKYAFQILNANYQKNKDKWLIYSNYKSSIFNFGSSQQAKPNLLVFEGKRRSLHFLGPIRTWRIKLIRHIPIQYHTDEQKKWFTTDYDDAIQYPLFQLSGKNRILYVPQILYQYNAQYGDNDNSTDQKRKKRKKTYNYVLSLKPLKTLRGLQQAKKNQQIQKILLNDKGVNYIVIQ